MTTRTLYAWLDGMGHVAADSVPPGRNPEGKPAPNRRASAFFKIDVFEVVFGVAPRDGQVLRVHTFTNEVTA